MAVAAAVPSQPLAENEQLAPSLRRLRLDQLVSSPRFAALDTLESYFRCKQYEGLRYDWDGRYRGYGGDADISPGWYVPLKRRRPSTRRNLPKLIVKRFTNMVFGEERWPQLIVEGDENAQDYVRALSEAAGMKGAMQLLREKGGAQGTAVASFAFVSGRPRVTVHNAKHITVLQWADRSDLRPAQVLEAYSYPRTVYAVDGRSREVTFYAARYWDENVEVVWDPIPDELARNGTWSTAVKSYQVAHGFGFCPVYWTQNLPDADATDGLSDYDGEEDNFDEINRLKSATVKGTVANVDPTLVIKEDPATNNGLVRKGSENAIYSRGGAEYLELRGDAIKTAEALLKMMGRDVLDAVGCVLGDPDKMSAQAVSGEALRIVYMAMLAQADILREQYGRKMLVVMLRDMLRAAKAIASRPGQVVRTEDGQRLELVPSVQLSKRVVDGSLVDRNPGTSDEITLNWGPYFPATWQDHKTAVEATTMATGKKSLITRRTGIEAMAPIFGIADVDAEEEELDAQAVEDAAMMQAAFGAAGGEEGEPGGGGGGPPGPPGGGPPKRPGGGQEE